MLGKLKQIIMLLRIMATPQITRPPLSVLQELRKPEIETLNLRFCP